MKKKEKDLDVDFIGGQNNPLTKAEQLAISALFELTKKSVIGRRCVKMYGKRENQSN